MTILFLAAAALAQPATPAQNPHAGHGDHAGHAGHATAATPATPAAAAWSVETSTIAQLMGNPAAKAVVDRHLPGFSAHPMIGQAGPMTLRQVQAFAQGQITDAHLTAIQAELAALPAS